jgi:hypothetical protein
MAETSARPGRSDSTAPSVSARQFLSDWQSAYTMALSSRFDRLRRAGALDQNIINGSRAVTRLSEYVPEAMRLVCSPPPPFMLTFH